MLITSSQLKKCMPKCSTPDIWAFLLNNHLSLHGIVEPSQIAHFISQCGHESSDFNVLEENLNYSVKGLLNTFSKYFNSTNVNSYANKPKQIASRVYANRYGNGTEESGDGWKYRGSGLIQLTFSDNFKICSKDLYFDEHILLDNPDKVRTDKEAALMTALWYWDKNQLSGIEDVMVLTKKINGGENGLDDRKYRYELAMKVLTNTSF